MPQNICYKAVKLSGRKMETIINEINNYTK